MASMNGPNSQVNSTTGGGSSSTSSQMNNSSAGGSSGGNQAQQPQAPNVILTRKCLQDLVKQVDPNEQLDEDVEDLLLGYADEFFEQIIEGACAVAAHRKASAVEVRDLQTYLERSSNIWVPGFGSDETKAYKRAPVTEAHKQRMALIKKQLKKY
ncbi:Transcription initiation factor TFIID subunit 12 [Orchesella cincta]|uniref:Transcription initiation factor TFIID subunit 12 n=1 Tax=Orchesella cincta TaxID=48709 RepID=A0A1D2MID1_ORCCI|nr:Transcription initiation factor TFIID subunit 12 [Orchesella cincta]